MKEEDILLLITRFLSSRTSREENEWLAGWRAQSQEHEEEFQQIKTIWSAKQQGYPTDSLSKVFDRVKDKIAVDELLQSAYEPVIAVSRRKHYLYAAAAAILVLITGSFFFPGNRQTAPATQWQIAATGPGKKMEVRLPDGTVVLLAPQSVLRYPKEFAWKERNIQLSGEALFKVATDKDHPFTVFSAGTVTHVLGTIFNINARDSLHQVSISLLEGKVAVITKDQYILHPGEQLVYHPSAHKSTVQAFTTEEVTGWQTNTLVFRDEPLLHALSKIETMYGVKIKLENDAMKDIKFWGTFKNESLDSLLAFMETASGIHYRKNGNIIYLNQKP